MTRILFFLLLISIFSFKSFAENSYEVIREIENSFVTDPVKEKVDLNSYSEDISINRGLKSEKVTDSEEDSKDVSEMKIDVKDNENQKQSLEMKNWARIAYSGGNYEVAVEIYKKILNVNKNDLYALYWLGNSYQNIGQTEEAKDVYLKLLKLSPNSKQAVSSLLSVLSYDDPSGSVELISRMANSNPSKDYIAFHAAIAYFNIKKYDQAIIYMQRALAISPNNPSYKYNMAVMLDNDGKYKEASVIYKDLISSGYSSDLNSEYGNFTIPYSQIKDRLNYIKLVNKS